MYYSLKSQGSLISSLTISFLYATLFRIDLFFLPNTLAPMSSPVAGVLERQCDR